MEKLLTILSRKQSHFHNVSTSSLVSDALSQMSCENVDYLIVVDENEHFAGILSEHDIAAKVMFVNKPLDKINVRDVMNNHLPHAGIHDTVEGCMKMMQRHHVRVVPVFEEFNFIGVVTSDDILEEAVYNRLEIFDA